MTWLDVVFIFGVVLLICKLTEQKLKGGNMFWCGTQIDTEGIATTGNKSEKKQPNYLDADHVVKCDVCKCLIMKQDAVRGQSRIEKSFLLCLDYFENTGTFDKETIEKVYYCHAHAPKAKRVVKKKQMVKKTKKAK